MRRGIALTLLAALLFGACGGGGANDTSAVDDEGQAGRVDAQGNPIAAGEDWSGVGGGAESAVGTSGGEGPPDERTEGGIECGVPTTTPEQGEAAPPGFDPDAPLEEPDNDFPIEATISPTRGDPGTDVAIDVVAVGQPDALVVVLARFFDEHHHGMRSAKVADVTGRTSFDGPIPETAPVGLAKIAVSATSSDGEQTALKVLDFVVTGPGCE